MLAAHVPARQGSCTTMNFIILKIKWDSKRAREEFMQTHNSVKKPKERHKMKNAQQSKLRLLHLHPRAALGYYSLNEKNIRVQGAQESFKYLL